MARYTHLLAYQNMIADLREEFPEVKEARPYCNLSVPYGLAERMEEQRARDVETAIYIEGFSISLAS